MIAEHENCNRFSEHFEELTGVTVEKFFTLSDAHWTLSNSMMNLVRTHFEPSTYHDRDGEIAFYQVGERVIVDKVKIITEQ